jgi:predicted O-methyltransferase YrrM
MTTKEYALPPKIERLVSESVMEAIKDCARSCPPGAVVEVGVYQGGSAMGLYEVCEEQGRPLFLYDTFTGIPFQGPFDSHKVGDFSETAAEMVSAMMPKAVVVQGVFPKIMVEMPPIAFVHLDCDQEQSIRESLDALAPQMVKGGVIWLDDVGCLDGANKAFNEWREKNKMQAYQSPCNKFYMVF